MPVREKKGHYSWEAVLGNLLQSAKGKTDTKSMISARETDLSLVMVRGILVLVLRT